MATRAGQGWHAPLPRRHLLAASAGDAAPIGREALDADPDPAGAPERSTSRPIAPLHSRTKRPQHGPASPNVRLAQVPLTGSAQGPSSVNFAKRVVQQGLPCPTPPNADLNIEAGTTVAGRVCAPLRVGASARRTTFQICPYNRLRYAVTVKAGVMLRPSNARVRSG